jgi:hypothetical protein
MSLTARRELASSLSLRYRNASRSDKSRILDEFILSCGYNRKYAVDVLKRAADRSPKPNRAERRRGRKYGSDVEHGFASLWRESGGLCAKRLVPFLPELIDALERFNEISLSSSVRAKLLEMSISTASRLLQRVKRQSERGIATTRPGTLLRQQIPIRTYEDWSENRPGFAEIDLVAHCGGTASGEFCYTLTVTDICTGWTECAAIPNRSKISVRDALEKVKKRLPFALLGIDSDNGSEFINHMLKDWCDERRITFTRCRPYKKNDQCHVEQKNGAVVRPLVGYARYEGAEACAHLNKLYLLYRLLVNYFEPSMKLIGKTRNGSKVVKKYDAARTPWQRFKSILESQEETKPQAEKNQHFYRTLNPARLRRDLHDLEAQLRRFTSDDPHPEWAQGAANRNVTIEQGGQHAQDA